MANFGRSFKPSSYFNSMSRRPAGPSRTLSNMSSQSDMSPLSSPDLRSDDIVFSARSSPAPPGDYTQMPMSPQRYLRTSGTRSPPRSINIDESSSSSASSKPIAIELPTVNHANRTPPAPLSARGDLPGGYFPLHEEQNRVYRPHPFQLDASKARTRSIQRAHKASSSDLPATASVQDGGDATNPTIAITSPKKDHPTMQIPQLNLNMTSIPSPESNSTTHTPVASYMPLGSKNNSLSMGKYYPSNYKQRKDAKRKAQNHRPSTSEPTSYSSSKSESQVPTLSTSESPGHTSGHVRNESEARLRLQQYQRDMIAQATMALNGGNVTAATRTSLRSLGFTNIVKPSKPRLAPLGSPGPVTPMELEGSDGGFFGAIGAVDTQEEVARAIRAEEDRSRRENTSSPVIDLGPSSL